jgi:mRNA interferase MazF
METVFRGNVYLVDLGHSIGSVQEGVRPCVVISNDANNLFSQIVQVIPFTSTIKNDLPIHYILLAQKHKFLDVDSMALTEQITTISKEQILQYIGTLDKRDMENILLRLDIQLGRK